MKKVITIIALILSFTAVSHAQDAMMKKNPEVIKLSQTPGEFVQKSKTVKAGTYVFEITNNNAAPEVGFVLVKKGEDVSNPDNHIKTAYVTQVVKKGQTERSSVTTLAKGEYVYFCPLNKTSTDNTLIVQ